MGGRDHLPERVCCGVLSGGNSSSENVKGGARDNVGGGAGEVLIFWSPAGGSAGGKEGGGVTEDSGVTEGSGAEKAGFRRSMEMTYGWPCLEMVKVFSPRFRTGKGPLYGLCRGRRTASCRT